MLGPNDEMLPLVVLFGSLILALFFFLLGFTFTSVFFAFLGITALFVEW